MPPRATGRKAYSWIIVRNLRTKRLFPDKSGTRKAFEQSEDFEVLEGVHSSRDAATREIHRLKKETA